MGQRESGAGGLVKTVKVKLKVLHPGWLSVPSPGFPKLPQIAVNMKGPAEEWERC